MDPDRSLDRRADLHPRSGLGEATTVMPKMISRITVRMRPALAVAIALSAVLTGCTGAGNTTTIDGFRLGAIEACSPPLVSDAAALDRSCAGYQTRAMAALDAREPGHPAIASIRMYSDGTQPGPIDVTGDAAVPTPAPRHLGPTVTVSVFTLTDGSSRATGVACTEDGPCVGVVSYPS
jgi:hypothetical protein